MNLLLTDFAASLTGWLADFYLLATLLLGLSFIAFRCLRQPVHRLSVAWIAMIELAVLAVVCALPGWPRISLIAAAPTVASPAAKLTAGGPHRVPKALQPARLEGGNSAGTAKTEGRESPASPERRWFATLPSLPAMIGFGFLVGAGLTGCWLAWGAAATARLRRRTTAAPPALAAELAAIAPGARLPPLLLSRRIGNAAAVGVLRPAILLPSGVSQGSPPQSLRAVLSHEWAHVRNRDLWLLALGRYLLVLLFAHPLFWWLRRRIRDDQEAVADAVAACDNGADYAAELLRWVRLTAGLSPVRVYAAAGLWESSSQLTRRIAMLLDETFHVQTTASRRWKYPVAGLLILLAAAFSVLTLQPRSSAAEPSSPPGVLTYHAKFTPPMGSMGEAWIQLNPDGAPLRGRIDYLKTEDGDKVVILSEGRCEVWFKTKKGDSISPDAQNDGLRRITGMRPMCDPNLELTRLQAEEAAGKVQIETKEPAKEGDYRILTVTSKDAPDLRAVCEVNPSTNRAERVTYYTHRGDQWQRAKVAEQLKEVDPKVFNLDLPKNVTIYDEIKRKPGLLKGDLTDRQVAAKVAREFFEALIAKDYDKAGLIYGGMPAEKAKEGYGRLNVSRIVEIGEPTAGVHPDPTALAVTVKVELGPKTWVAKFSPQVPLTDNETATKQVREFLEALAGYDEATARRLLNAGLVFEGFSAANADKVKELFDDYKLLRIVEVGKPAPYPGTDRLEVPVKVEIEREGERVQEFTPYIRPVFNQPDRWDICGGI